MCSYSMDVVFSFLCYCNEGTLTDKRIGERKRPHRHSSRQWTSKAAKVMRDRRTAPAEPTASGTVPLNVSPDASPVKHSAAKDPDWNLSMEEDVSDEEMHTDADQPK